MGLIVASTALKVEGGPVAWRCHYDQGNTYTRFDTQADAMTLLQTLWTTEGAPRWTPG